jgi:hypothetical protein
MVSGVDGRIDFDPVKITVQMAVTRFPRYRIHRLGKGGGAGHQTGNRNDKFSEFISHKSFN